MNQVLKFFFFIIVVFTVNHNIFSSVHNNDQENILENDSKKIENQHSNVMQEDISFFLRDSDVFLGDKNAPVVMTEYFSPTCPHCVYYYNNIFPKIKKKYIDTGKLLYIFREFIASAQDLYASVLMRCQNDIAKYLEYKKAILLTQRDWISSSNFRKFFLRMGELRGLSEDEYKTCFSNIQEIVIQNSKLVHSQKNFGTPAFFIQGEYFDKPYSFENLSHKIDEILNSKNHNIDEE